MSSNNNKEFQRKTYFIHKKFQTGMIVKNVSLIIVLAVISSITIYYLTDGELEASYFEAHATIESMRANLLPMIIVINFLSVLIISVASVFTTLYSSHKIAGPLFKMEKVINEISAGNLDMAVRLRQDDQVKTLGNALDNMTDKLSDKLKSIKSISNDMSKVEEELLDIKHNKTFTEKEINEILELVKSDKERLNTELDAFILKS